MDDRSLGFVCLCNAEWRGSLNVHASLVRVHIMTM